MFDKMMIVKVVERLTKTRIFPVWKLPRRGIDIYEDLATLPVDVHVAFDVGANVGQTAKSFLREFPRATVYSFEPVEATFRILQNMKQDARFKPFQIALGAATGNDRVVHQGTHDMYHLLGESSAPEGADIEEVTVYTIDAFCNQQGISRINFLKIDTEGSDLDVLVGAQQMLAARRIDVLQVEAGMNKNNQYHVPFEQFKEFLEPRGYFLFGLYEQVSEWPTKEPHLRRTNSVFISDSVIKTSR